MPPPSHKGAPKPTKNPQKNQEELFSTRVMPTDKEIKVKILFVVAKKSAKNATKRNLIKRRCRQAAREAGKLTGRNKKVIFYIKPTAGEAKYSVLKNAITQKLTEIGLLKK